MISIYNSSIQRQYCCKREEVTRNWNTVHFIKTYVPTELIVLTKIFYVCVIHHSSNYPHAVTEYSVIISTREVGCHWWGLLQPWKPLTTRSDWILAMWFLQPWKMSDFMYQIVININVHVCQMVRSRPMIILLCFHTQHHQHCTHGENLWNQTSEQETKQEKQYCFWESCFFHYIKYFKSVLTEGVGHINWFAC